MKKILAFIMITILAVSCCALVSCDDDTLNNTTSGDLTSGNIDSGAGSGDLVSPSVTVVFDVDGATYDSVVVSDGDVSFPADPSKDNYLFDGWFTDKDVWQNRLTSLSEIRQNTTVYAKWTKISATVTYDSQKSALENGAILQAAIDNAEDNTAVIVNEGTYNVTHKGKNDGIDYDRNLVVSNDNVKIIGVGEVSIVSDYTSGIEEAQQTVTVKADNVYIQNVSVYPVENYVGRSKTFAISGGNNVTVKDCTIYGTLYIGSPEVGKYTISDNVIKNYAELQKTSVNIANGAGSNMKEEENSIIENNKCEGAILLLGVRDNNWDNNELTRIPVIKNNTFGPVYKQEKNCYLLIGSDKQDSISQDTVTFILTNNAFTGKTGDFECYDFEFYGTYYSYWY